MPSLGVCDHGRWAAGSLDPRPKTGKQPWLCPTWRFGFPGNPPTPHMADYVKVSISEGRKLGHLGKVWPLKATLWSTDRTRWNHPASGCGSQIDSGMLWVNGRTPFHTSFAQPHPMQLCYPFSALKLNTFSTPWRERDLGWDRVHTHHAHPTPLGQPSYLSLECDLVSTWH